jgi:hypothetical protein
MKLISSLFLTSIFIFSCSVRKGGSISSSNQLKFIGEYKIAYNQQFKNTTIGGLSGIDYDSKNGFYYLISDDRSDINPARFYTAKIFLNEKAIDSVQFVDVTYLLQPNGQTYPSIKQDSFHTSDAEAMRYNSKTNELVWSSEGERIVKNNSAILTNPFVYSTTKNAAIKDSFLLPSNMRMSASENGPRRNGVFEGLCFANNFKTLYVSVEEPIYEDGPRAGLNDSTAWTRIIKFDAATKKPLAEYAYQIDAVPFSPKPEGGFKVNGVVDILEVGKNSFLVMERAFSAGRKPSSIRVYLTGLNGGSDVSHTASLKDSNGFVPLSKKLLLNMDNLKFHIDNIEGVSFGPRLSSGHQTLIFVSDNNFSEEQVTQFLLFEID